MAKRIAILVGLVVAMVLAATPAHADIEAQQVVGNLNEPVGFTFGPDGKIWYGERGTGRVRIVDPATGDDVLFVDVEGVTAAGERGLLGIALDPQYPDRPYVYVYATRTISGGAVRNEIVRYEDRDGNGIDPTVLFSAPASSSPYHNGGRIAFGPDGMLYAIVGDGHDSSNSQDTSNNDRGKIIRIDPDGHAPDSNPLGNRIWAYGIRNSFGFTWDPETGALWETENGPECNDEVNRIRRGGNFGWGPSESCSGAAPGNTNGDGPDPIRPKLFYASTIGITGIAFCDQCGLGGKSNGAAFIGAVNDGRVERLILNHKRKNVERHSIVYDHPSGTLSFEVGPGGAIYFSDFGGIYQLVRT
jgi:glucose/arabinose dehydrogenase